MPAYRFHLKLALLDAILQHFPKCLSFYTCAPYLYVTILDVADQVFRDASWYSCLASYWSYKLSFTASPWTGHPQKCRHKGWTWNKVCNWLTFNWLLECLAAWCTSSLINDWLSDWRCMCLNRQIDSRPTGDPYKGWQMVKSEICLDAEILVKNPSPRFLGKNFQDSKKVKPSHAKTRLRDLWKTLSRF